MPEEPLALLLLRASRWFDRQLLQRLEDQGWPRLTPAQSLVFPHLASVGTSPAELARALGVTRQSAHELVAGLIRLDLLASAADPRSPRRRQLLLTTKGEQLAADARTILASLEADLRAGAGRQHPVETDVLRRLLAVDPFTDSGSPTVDVDHPRTPAVPDPKRRGRAEVRLP